MIKSKFFRQERNLNNTIQITKMYLNSFTMSSRFYQVFICRKHLRHFHRSRWSRMLSNYGLHLFQNSQFLKRCKPFWIRNHTRGCFHTIIDFPAGGLPSWRFTQLAVYDMAMYSVPKQNINLSTKIDVESPKLKLPTSSKLMKIRKFETNWVFVCSTYSATVVWVGVSSFLLRNQ